VASIWKAATRLSSFAEHNYGIYRCNMYKNVKLLLCVTKQHSMKTYLSYVSIMSWRRIEGVELLLARILNLGSWRWVVSFTPQSLYDRSKSHRYPFG